MRSPPNAREAIRDGQAILPAFRGGSCGRRPVDRMRSSPEGGVVSGATPAPPFSFRNAYEPLPREVLVAEEGVGWHRRGGLMATAAEAVAA